MDVEYHFDLLAHRITHRRKLLDGSNQRAAGIEGSILLGQTPAREAPPLLPALQARLDEGGGVQAGFLVVRVAELAQFPDMRMTIEAMVSDGDTVAVRVLSEGTNLGSR